MKKLFTSILACTFAYSFAQISITKDLSYGSNGVVNLSSYVTSETDFIKPMANGEVLLSVYNPGGAKFIKIKNDGSFDPSFGNNGVLTVTDDRILSIHNNYFYGGREFQGRYYIKRYFVSNGNVDTNFGVNGVLDAGLMYQATMITQSDGEILVRSQSGFKRYSSTGVLDTTFATNGSYSEYNVYGTHFLKMAGNNLYEYASDQNFAYGVYKRNIATASTDLSYGYNGKSMAGCPNGTHSFGFAQYLDNEGELMFLYQNELSKKLSDGNVDTSFGNGGCLDLQMIFNGMVFNYSEPFHHHNGRFYFTLKNHTDPSDQSVRFVIYNMNGNLMTINNQQMYDTELVDDQYGYIGTSVVGNYLYMIGFSKVSRYILSEASLSANESLTKNSDVNFVNPFNDVLSLKTDKDIKNVEIFDQNGRLILKSSKTEINTSSLSKGVYQIKITTKSGEIISKKGMKN